MVKIISGDPYRLQQIQKTMVADFLKDNDALNLEIIDLSRSEIIPSDLISRLSSVSLFAPNRLIVLENLSAAVDFTKHIEQIYQAPIEGVTLLIILSKSERTGDWVKFLRKQKGYQEYKAYQGVELVRWLCQKAKTEGSLIEPAVAEHLIDRVGVDLFTLDNELQKLSVYPKVTRDLVNQLTTASPNSQIFELLNSLLQGDVERSLILYEEQRQQKNEPLAMLGALLWQLQILLTVKTSSKSVEETARYFELHVFPVKKALSSVRRMSWKYLNKLLELCWQAERNIKVDFMNPDEALRYLIVRGASLSK